jgi:hypothetical protein
MPLFAFEGREPVISPDPEVYRALARRYAAGVRPITGTMP